MTQITSSGGIPAQVFEDGVLRELKDAIERQMRDDQTRTYPLGHIEARIQISPGIAFALEREGYRVSVRNLDPDLPRITVSWGRTALSPAWAALKPVEVELVQTTLELIKLSTECEVRLTPAQFTALLERLPTYNGMLSMESLGSEIDALMPRYDYPGLIRGVPNCNHGTVAHKYLVGNKSSLSVMVRLPASGIAPFNLSVLVGKLNKVAQSHGADEYGKVLSSPDYYGLAYRMWWD